MMLELLFRLIHELMFLTGYVGNSNAFPKKLSPEEEKKYLELFEKGDMEARNILVEHNLRLVAHIAKKYSNEYNADDLISVGIIGLIKGINTFKPEKNNKLAAYISRCIDNEILMFLRSTKKISNETSLDEAIGTDKDGNALTIADIIPAENEDIIEAISVKNDIKKLYRIMERVLKKSEIDIIIKRYGLGGIQRKTQREVAAELGISRSYVSRIEKKALKKLAEEFKRE